MENNVEKPTQRERILTILKDADGGWVDGMIFLQIFPPITQFHARIFELQRLGYRIESRFISDKTWKEYKLVVSPEQRAFDIH